MPYKTLLSSTALIMALPLMLAANTAWADVANDPINFGTLGGTMSSVYDISADGSVVVGYAYNASGQSRAFRWTQETGMVDLGTLGGAESSSHSVSSDGSVVVGYAYSALNQLRAFRWTQETGMVDLGTLGGTTASANSISRDRKYIVGDAQNASNQSRAYRWSQETGMVNLGTLGGTNSYAWGVSDDGSVVVGHSRITSSTNSHVFRWTESTGMVDLGTLGGTRSLLTSLTNTISADGEVVVGYAYTTGDIARHAFRWTQETGMIDLGTLGGTESVSIAVSRDGTRVGGRSYLNGGSVNTAFYWTQEAGMQNFNTLLANAGVDMSNVSLGGITSFSDNNRYIVGYAYFNGSTNLSAYLACYDPGENGCVGLTTASKQEEAAVDLASNQQIAMTESRSAANELMGFTRPMTMGTQTFSGAMFGSAMGYAGGQYTKDRFTLLGGLGYGAQDYKYIKPENALTVASGLRYTFDSVTGEQVGVGSVAPFVEAGGWYTPDMKVALSRPYNNGTGTNRGEGNTNSSSWAEYVKAGLVWDQSDVNQFTAYGEIGRQHMLFDGYSELATSTNPFPATISDSEMAFNFARAGGSWTRQLDKFMGKPVSFTLAGAVAHSFGVKTNLTTTVSGVGTAHAIAKKNLWAEYGGRISSDLTDTIALNLDVTGTTGNNGMGTAIHGGAGVSLKF